MSGSPIITFGYTRDDGGRIATKTETVNGQTTTISYGYDPAGRLTDVTTGSATTHYGYDDNGNRTSVTNGSGTIAATYDAQDRMTTYNGASYFYSDNGELQKKIDARGTTLYNYDVLGNLRSVTLPDGRLIEYVIDASNRRVGKKVNGTLVAGWIYADQLRIVAETDGTGTVTKRFVYGSRTNTPDYMVWQGSTYRIISDHLGSPRYVLQATAGTLAEAIIFAEFGNVLSDTTPGFQPFGFGGGLYDPDTKLVRFGERDYDAQTGRWTAKDPSGFGGGQANLYEYTFTDPVNFVDPAGMSASSTICAPCQEVQQAGCVAAGMGDCSRKQQGLFHSRRGHVRLQERLVHRCDGDQGDHVRQCDHREFRRGKRSHNALTRRRPRRAIREPRAPPLSGLPLAVTFRQAACWGCVRPNRAGVGGGPPEGNEEAGVWMSMRTRLLVACALFLLAACTKLHDVIIVNCTSNALSVDVIDGTTVTPTAVRPNSAVRVVNAVHRSTYDQFVFKFKRGGNVVKVVTMSGTQLSASEWVVQLCDCR